MPYLVCRAARTPSIVTSLSDRLNVNPEAVELLHTRDENRTWKEEAIGRVTDSRFALVGYLADTLSPKNHLIEPPCSRVKRDAAKSRN